MQKIFLADISGIDSERSDEMTMLLPLKERERVLAVKDEKLHKQTLLGALMIKAFTADGELFFSEKGKPYKIGLPQFNLSHAGDKVALYISDESAVGIDIEKIRPLAKGVSSKIFGEEEKAYAEKFFSESEADISLWTIKEAAAKCIGSGVTAPKKQIATRFSEDSFNFSDKRIYYKVYKRGEYVLTAAAYKEVNAEIEEIDTSRIVLRIKNGTRS